MQRNERMPRRIAEGNAELAGEPRGVAIRVRALGRQFRGPLVRPVLQQAGEDDGDEFDVRALHQVRMRGELQVRVGRDVVEEPGEPRHWRISPCAEHDVLLRGEAFEAHRAARVQLVGGDADLRAEAVLEAVGEARRGVHHHRARIDFAQETLRVRVVLGDDGVGVRRAVLGDVLHRRVESFTTRTARIGARYSVYQSSSVAGLHRRDDGCARARRRAAPRPCRSRSSRAAAAPARPRPRCTSSVSMVLQVP